MVDSTALKNMQSITRSSLTQSLGVSGVNTTVCSNLIDVAVRRGFNTMICIRREKLRRI